LLRTANLCIQLASLSVSDNSKVDQTVLFSFFEKEGEREREREKERKKRKKKKERKKRKERKKGFKCLHNSRNSGAYN
jgi:hypothetical protein